MSPLYFPLAFVGLPNWDPASLILFARIVGKFTAAAFAALSAVLLLLLLQRITTTRWAWCLTLVYALATETWSISSQALWQHGPGELAILGCFYCLERWSEDRTRNDWLWLCGLSTAAAFVIRPTNLVLLPAVVAALLLAKATFTQHVRLLADAAPRRRASRRLQLLRVSSAFWRLWRRSSQRLRTAGSRRNLSEPRPWPVDLHARRALCAVRVLALRFRGTPPAQSAARDGGGFHHPRIACHLTVDHMVGWLLLGVRACSPSWFRR